MAIIVLDLERNASKRVEAKVGRRREMKCGCGGCR